MNTPDNSGELSEGLLPWEIGDPTKHPPVDSGFLETLAKSGFSTYTGPIGICGAKSNTRSVIAIHRGRGKRWELIFRQLDKDVVVTMSTDLIADAKFAAKWLRGETLHIAQDSLCESPFRPVGANDSI